MARCDHRTFGTIYRIPNDCANAVRFCGLQSLDFHSIKTLRLSGRIVAHRETSYPRRSENIGEIVPDCTEGIGVFGAVSLSGDSAKTKDEVGGGPWSREKFRRRNCGKRKHNREQRRIEPVFPGSKTAGAERVSFAQASQHPPEIGNRIG